MTLRIVKSTSEHTSVALCIAGKNYHMPKKPKKDQGAVRLGKLGGKARAQKLTPEQRKESARKAAMARWAKKKNSPKSGV